MNGIYAPKLLNKDDDTMTITMEFITFDKLDLASIIDAGDEGIFKYAKARYKLEKTLLSNCVEYWDWKNEHQFYNKEKEELILIDYDSDQTDISSCNPLFFKDIENQLEKKYSFLKSPVYQQEKSYQDFVEMLKSYKYKM